MTVNIKNIPECILWENNTLTLLDQTQLPEQVVYEEQHSIEQVWDSIKKLKVRGAPAIGVAAAYGLVVGLSGDVDKTKADFLKALSEKASYLDSSRPTAVNLRWAMDRMVQVGNSCPQAESRDIFQVLVEEACRVEAEDRELCRSIGEHGKSLIKEGMGVLTHCNAGSLATGGMGTALAPIYLAAENGVSFKVYSDETRPLLQGSRLTCWELNQAGVDVTLQTDNMAAHMMQEGHIDLIIVGADRVAANGDAANKIGTLSVAIAANYFNIPFYVAVPSSTIDLSTPTGKEIEIEQRQKEEVIRWGEHVTAPTDIKVVNPAFDVTPHSLIAGIITEKGVIRSSYLENLKKNFS